jgi:hypothetical protein
MLYVVVITITLSALLSHLKSLPLSPPLDSEVYWLTLDGQGRQSFRIRTDPHLGFI